MSDEKVGYAFRALHAEIVQDLSDIERLVNECKVLHDDVLGVPSPKKHEMLALAAYLHHFYTGAESIFERVADTVDQQKPSGSDRHRQLLRRVSLDLPDIRPPVISRRTHAKLDEYRGFRHVFRHAYGIVIDWKRLKLLLEQLPNTFGRLCDDMHAFLRFLEQSIEHEAAGDEDEEERRT